MTTTTPNLGLKEYNSTTDSSLTFAVWRADVAGISPTSNMGLIDTWAGNVSGSLTTLMNNRPPFYVDGIIYDANNYEVFSSEITSYNIHMMLSLALNTTNASYINININSLGFKALQKVDSGSLVAMSGGELEVGKRYLFQYNGTSFEWIYAAAASGSSSGGAPIDAEYVLASTNGTLTNGKIITAGSNIEIDSSGSQVLVHSTASGQALEVVSGSGISVVTSGSTSTVNLSTTGVISGSYNKIEVDQYGRVISGSVIDNRIPLSASRVYYIDSVNGNDSYDGLTSGSPFKTMQHLIDIVGSSDPKIYSVVGIPAPGTYDECLTLESMNLIKSFEIRGDTRLLAGLAYVDGKDARMPLTSTGNNGGAGAVSFIRSGSSNNILTINCATTPVDFSADGWGSGDVIIVYDGTTPNNVTELTLSSTTGSNLIATGSWPDPAVGTSGSGYSIVLKPNVIINPTTDTTSYVFTMNNTRNLILTGLHFQGSSTRNIMYIKNFCQLTLQGVSLQGGASYHINCLGNSIVTNQGAILWKAFTSIDSAYGVSGQQEGQLRLQYATVIKGTTWGFSAQVNSCGATYGYNLAVKCGKSFYATLMSSISAYFSSSIGATVDDYDPDVNTSGNGNSYIRQ